MFGFPHGSNLKSSEAWFRIATAVAAAMNLAFIYQLYLSPDGDRWHGALLGWILWNLFPATLFGIAALLRKEGR
jgi:hypothetical protein